MSYGTLFSGLQTKDSSGQAGHYNTKLVSTFFDGTSLAGPRPAQGYFLVSQFYWVINIGAI